MVRAPQHDAVQARLRALGVASGTDYSNPEHLQPAYRGRVALAPRRGSEAASREVFSLRLQPELTDGQVEQVCVPCNIPFTPAGREFMTVVTSPAKTCNAELIHHDRAGAADVQ